MDIIGTIDSGYVYDWDIINGYYWWILLGLSSKAVDMILFLNKNSSKPKVNIEKIVASNLHVIRKNYRSDDKLIITIKHLQNLGCATMKVR